MAKGISNIGGLLKQAQELQERVSRVQEELGQRTVSASAGGGMVTAVVSGRLQLVSLSIDAEALATADREMLQDLVVAAVNEGIRRAQAMMNEELGKLTGGLKIPGMG